MIYHNKYADMRGWIKTSVGFMDKSTGNIVQKTLSEGLGLRGGAHDYVIFRDVTTGQEYIRASRGLVEQGLYVELGAYKCHAFVDFREVSDDPADILRWTKVCQTLNGGGVPSMNNLLNEMFAPPLVVEEPIVKKKVTRKKAAPKKIGEKKESAKKKTTTKVKPQQ